MILNLLSILSIHRDQKRINYIVFDSTAGAVQSQPGAVSRVGPEGGEEERGSAEEGQHGHPLVQLGPPVQHQRHVNVDVVVRSPGVVIVDPASLSAPHQVPGSVGEVVPVYMFLWTVEMFS